MIGSIRDQPLSRAHGASRVPVVGGATGGRSSHVWPGVAECGPIIRRSKTSDGAYLFLFLFLFLFVLIFIFCFAASDVCGP